MHSLNLEMLFAVFFAKQRAHGLESPSKIHSFTLGPSLSLHDLVTGSYPLYYEEFRCYRVVLREATGQCPAHSPLPSFSGRLASICESYSSFPHVASPSSYCAAFSASTFRSSKLDMLALVFTLAFAVLGASALAFQRRRNRLPLPPGPKPWPFIGNVLDMPVDRFWAKYCEWCKTYESDVVYLHLPMQPTLIVGTVDAAVELLDKRSQIYSSRVPSLIADLMGWDHDYAFMPYSATWRAHRRMFHQYFHPGVVDQYRPAQLQEVRRFMSLFLDSPQHTRDHVRYMISSIIALIVYGKQLTGIDDEFITTAQIAFEGGGLTTLPGAYWLNYMPFIRYIPSWIPGNASMKLVEKYRPYVVDLVDVPWVEVKTALANGTARSSVATALLEENRIKYSGSKDESEYDIIARNVVGLAYGAGSDTTSSSCQSFLLAMAMFPGVQTKAQGEIAKVVDADRLPEYEDLEKIPYMKALVMETMRWMPPTPFAIPHALTADDVYDGYHIPKGTMVVPNVWGMLHNPQDYPNPGAFNPDRFIGEDGNINPKVRDPTTVAFGFGRRICQGKHFSNNTLSIFIATILHVFDISAGTDTSGDLVPLHYEMHGSLVSAPRDVPCGLKLRSAAAEYLIRGGTNSLPADEA
ncbi:hypothetical protein EIP91_001595 [Steccherinum ochraceum]|uniref:Cytochrome P450 n=1 Tax=Steccherinum ochraceum TaxID=92696 RepID=A0A4R0RG63_9APHY|nr:hypothetical protein EIP91_001595 [Steccherinum ochraceum]